MSEKNRGKGERGTEGDEERRGEEDTHGVRGRVGLRASGSSRH